MNIYGVETCSPQPVQCANGVLEKRIGGRCASRSEFTQRLLRGPSWLRVLLSSMLARDHSERETAVRRGSQNWPPNTLSTARGDRQIKTCLGEHFWGLMVRRRLPLAVLQQQSQVHTSLHRR